MFSAGFSPRLTRRLESEQVDTLLGTELSITQRVSSPAEVVIGMGEGRFDPNRAGSALQKLPKSFESAEAIVGARGLDIMFPRMTHKLNTAFRSRRVVFK